MIGTRPRTLRDTLETPLRRWWHAFRARPAEHPDGLAAAPPLGVVAALPQPLFVVGRNGRIRYANPAWLASMAELGLAEVGSAAGSAPGRTVEALFARLAPEPEAGSPDPLDAIRGVAQRGWPRAGATFGVGTAATRRTLRIDVVPLAAGALVVQTDLSAQRLRERELAFRAHHDDLTGLSRRDAFAEQTLRLLALAERQGRSLHIVYLDIDDFKGINDRFGHETGDALLVAVAERLTAEVRKSDLLGRLGGDEFAAAALDDGTTATIGRRFHDALAAPFDLGGRLVRVAVSIGVASYPDDGADLRTLLRRADAAMYAAKRCGEGVWLAAATAGGCDGAPLGREGARPPP